MKYVISALNTADEKRTQQFNYDCALVCIEDLIKSCANEILEEEKLALPSFLKIAALLSTTTALVRESEGLRVTDFARIAFIRQTFETRVRAYQTFRAEIDSAPT